MALLPIFRSRAFLMHADELVFDDLTPREVPVRVGDRRLVLREATAAAACAWRNALLRATKLGPDGKPAGLGDMADTEPLLVSLCLFDEGGKPVPLHQVRAWPSRVVTALFERAKELSGLAEGGGATAARGGRNGAEADAAPDPTGGRPSASTAT